MSTKSGSVEDDAAVLCGGCPFDGLHLASELRDLRRRRVSAMSEEQRRPEDHDAGCYRHGILGSVTPFQVRSVMRAVGYGLRLGDKLLAGQVFVNSGWRVGALNRFWSGRAGRKNSHASNDGDIGNFHRSLPSSLSCLAKIDPAAPSQCFNS